MNDRLSHLAVRESELRAVLEREVTLQPYEERLVDVLDEDREAKDAAPYLDR